MRSFPIKVLLIASLGWWFSGAAGFVHERMEANEAGSDAVVASAPNSPPVGPHAPKHKHSADDCPFCQLLATMRAEAGVTFSPPVVQLAPCGLLVLTCQDAPALIRLSAFHSRGPPFIQL